LDLIYPKQPILSEIVKTLFKTIKNKMDFVEYAGALVKGT